MNRLRVAALVLLLGAAPLAQATHKPCSKADAAAAEKAVEKILDWKTLHKTWSDYHHCDTGKVAESFTDAVLRLMIGSWKSVAGLASDWRSDTAYREFLTKRLQAKEAEADREDIFSLAKASCPKGQEAFCKEIAEVVTEPPAKSAAPAPAPAPAATPAPPATPPATPPAAAK